MKKLKQKVILKNKWGIQTKGDSKVGSKIQCFNVSY